MTIASVLHLKDAISALIASPDRSEKINAALQNYLNTPRDTQTTKALFAELAEKEKFTDPIEEILKDAWSAALQEASRDGAIKPIDQGEALTIFSDVWDPLCLDGWDSLPSYRHNQFCEALAKLTLENSLNAVREMADTPAEISAKILHDIASGNIERCKGLGDFFINSADGVHLDVTMQNWAPVLRDRHKKSGAPKAPMGMPNDLIFSKKVKFPSGRVLISDHIGIKPVNDTLEKTRASMGLSVNYAWHRILRTISSIIHSNIIDIAMGSDGPGLVRSIKSEVFFAGYESSGFQNVANVCHDYWGTTMIDRSILCKLMVDNGCAKDIPAAETEIDAWLEDSIYHTEVSLTPGDWHFYFDDDAGTLSRELKTAAIDAPEGTRFVLSRDVLPLDPSKLRSFN